MPTTESAHSQCGMHGDEETYLKEIVMGLHWDPPLRNSDPVDLDALCALFDAEGRVLEVIHPGNPRSADQSVIHTGDSRTGSSVWDDERIFVFLEALPSVVSKLTFLVISASGRAFHEVPGAFCHVSDRVSEHERCRIDLTSLLGCTAHSVATLQRRTGSWRISTDVSMPHSTLLGELRTLLGIAKSNAGKLGAVVPRQSRMRECP
jgi:stress response protein SCP2